MCVMPAIGTLRLAFACSRNAFSMASRACWICAAASITKRRKSVATSSLRLRPVCSFQPSGIGLGAHCNFVERRQRLLHFRRSENSDGLERLRPGVIDGNLIRQKTAIERKRPLERVELRVWLALEASSPQPVVFAFGHRFLPGQGRRILRAQHFLCSGAACCATTSTNYCLLPSAFALGRTLTGSAKRLMKPSASFGL